MPVWDGQRVPGVPARSIHSTEADESAFSGCIPCTTNKGKKPMAYVGNGQGEYEKVIDHVYVGEGGGSYNMVEVDVPIGWKLRKCSICFIATSAMLVVVGLACLFFAGWGKPDDQKWSSDRPGTSDFDCVSSFDSWMTQWSAQRKDWCCRNYNRACPTTVVPTQYDCNEGRLTWEQTWSSQKKDWCCGFSREGCAALTTPRPTYDCSSTSNWAAWKAEQRDWCCVRYGRACRWSCDSAPSTWTQDQSTWCCQNFKKGLNCSAKVGVSQSNSSSSQGGCHQMCTYKNVASPCIERIKWTIAYDGPTAGDPCKAHSRVVHTECPTQCSGCSLAEAGCTNPPVATVAAPVAGPAVGTPPSNEDHDCESDAPSTWQPGRRAWCCQHKQIGCLPTARAVFDCSGPSEDQWPAEEKEWCCTHQKKGCSFDCNMGFGNWEKGWTAAKKAWCCAHEDRGCVQNPYDCSVDLDNWGTTWTVGKKDWCCQQEGLGCTPAPTHVKL